ncbi:hypothetical protein Q8A73_010557 [Channa argus]|nr:hypothetical protein Q8A73_010557 [Channa argus]
MKLQEQTRNRILGDGKESCEHCLLQLTATRVTAERAVSDPASLDGGLAGSYQEVPISCSSAKQRHRLWCWKASLKISTRRLACALAESRKSVEMQSTGKNPSVLWRQTSSVASPKQQAGSLNNQLHYKFFKTS